MVTDGQVRKLMKLIQEEKSLGLAASKAGMDEKTARKYRDLGSLPSEIAVEHTWRTRGDPFEEVWEAVREKLVINPGLEAKTLFDDLQRQYPGRFSDGQLRTLQRRVKAWRGLEGPGKEVFFEQRHRPGELSQSDFTSMNRLGVKISGQPFDHLIYHFVLPYSNWEAGTICYSESFESLSQGLQNALWELGGVPRAHRTDRMSAAVHKTDNPEEFTDRYKALLSHYRLEGKKIRTGRPNENGDIEQRHHRFKTAVDQSLMLRGSRSFESREQYGDFLRTVFDQLNAGRRARLEEELRVLRALPRQRLCDSKRVLVKVGSGSTIRVNHNTYTLNSRLIGETVKVRVHADRLDVWYAQRCVETMPRLRGEGKRRICYHHIIDWLLRKPGAFADYRYREDLFPTHRFRMAYDSLKRTRPASADKEYLRILHLAAYEGETATDEAILALFEQDRALTAEAVKEMLHSGSGPFQVKEVSIKDVDLRAYDELLERTEGASW